MGGLVRLVRAEKDTKENLYYRLFVLVQPNLFGAHLGAWGGDTDTEYRRRSRNNNAHSK